jgi:hypothetical protein
MATPYNYKGNNKSHVPKIPKSVYITVGSIVALLVLFVGAGASYTWYTGQHSDEAVSAAEAPAQTTPVPKHEPLKPAANAKASASVQSLTSPIAPGMNASVTIKTTPTASCKIVVEYNKVASQDSGLGPKTADEYGIVSWTWTVEKTAPLGKWPVTVTCEYNTRSAVVVGDLEVVAKVDQQQ